MVHWRASASLAPESRMQGNWNEGYISPLQTGLNAQKQRTALPAVAGDTIATGAALRYPVVGDATQASLNGFGSLPNVTFGSARQVWSSYPLLKRVRIANAATINWGGVRANGRAIGLTIYTPNVCYLWTRRHFDFNWPVIHPFPHHQRSARHIAPVVRARDIHRQRKFPGP